MFEKFLTLCFLSDYLNNDVYYKCNYEGHNIMRAHNPITLLKELCNKEAQLKHIVTQVLEVINADK